MFIETMLLGHKAIAGEDKLESMRQVCKAIMRVTELKDEWVLLYNEAEQQVVKIEALIDDLRREDAIAEQNAKYREDRPNA